MGRRGVWLACEKKGTGRRGLRKKRKKETKKQKYQLASERKRSPEKKENRRSQRRAGDQKDRAGQGESLLSPGMKRGILDA